jgi:hypothetical protein
MIISISYFVFACSAGDLRRKAMEVLEVPLPMVKLSVNPGHHGPSPTTSSLVPRVEKDDIRELPSYGCPWGLHHHLQVDFHLPNTLYMF